MNINTDSFIRISRIIARDSKDTSYKFALLRATHDVIDLYDHHIADLGDRVSIPIGLIIERWLWYYYPLIESDVFLPQKNGEPARPAKGKNIAFRQDFVNLIVTYEEMGGFDYFYNDYKKKNLGPDVTRHLKILVDKLYQTITHMPMRYIGRSVSEREYSIYQVLEPKRTPRNPKRIDTEFLLENYGRVAFPKDFYYVFRYLGGFLHGANSLIHNWADFIVRANREFSLEKTYVLEKLLYNPEVERDVARVRDYFSGLTDLECVWSGKSIVSGQLHVDHVLPFTHYLNNDTWNLLPTLDKVNSKKRDKIPTPYQLKKSRDRIIHYWTGLRDAFTRRFPGEVNVGLQSGIDFSRPNWENPMFHALEEKAKFLIEIRGLEGWEW
jgi:hypothetical protein